MRGKARIASRLGRAARSSRRLSTARPLSCTICRRISSSTVSGTDRSSTVPLWKSSSHHLKRHLVAEDQLLAGRRKLARPQTSQGLLTKGLRYS